MKKTVYKLGMSVLFLSLFSCYKDKGNYDYHEIGEITIENIEDKYRAIAFQDVLALSPKVTSTDPNDVLEYCWTVDKKPMTDDEKIETDTIGDEKDLNFPVELKKGDYTLTLFVTNQNTGFQVHKEIDLEIETPFVRGFYVLKEVAGNSELDLHLSDSEKIENVLTDVNGSPVEGKPVGLGMNFGYFFLNQATAENQCSNTLNICTENDMRIVNVEDLSTVYTYDDMYFSGEVPAGEKPYHMYTSGYGVSFATSVGFYYNTQYGPTSGAWGLPVPIDGGCVANKYVVTDGDNSYFFDTKNQRFLMCDWNGELGAFENTENSAYLPNDVPYDFVYMGRCDIAGGGYAIFKDPEESSKRYLYKLELNSHSLKNPITDVLVIDPSLNTNRAEMFACNELDADIIYAVVDNKIYAYEPTTNTETEIIPQGFATDEEITGIAYRWWTLDNDKEYNFKHLVICTHKDGNYKVYLYDLVGKQTYGAPKHVFTGTGKAVKIHYASPKQVNNLDWTIIGCTTFYSLSF